MSDSKERMIGDVPYPEYNKKAAKKRYDRLKAAGVCPRCGGPRNVLDHKTGKWRDICESCAQGLQQSKERKKHEGLPS